MSNPLSKTSLGESYILEIYRHLDPKEKYLLCDEGVYNVILCRKQCFTLVLKGTLMSILKIWHVFLCIKTALKIMH